MSIYHYDQFVSICSFCSPCIVADDANVEVAGRRIIWGKSLNAGQSCIAPDYVLCTAATQDRLVEVCKRALREFFGEVIIIVIISHLTKECTHSPLFSLRVSCINLSGMIVVLYPGGWSNVYITAESTAWLCQ